MSGGSYNYIYSTLSEECEGQMYDVELDDMVEDFVKVLRDLEWWQSDDISEEDYRRTVMKFKAKWFQGGEIREERQKKYIDDACEKLKKELNQMF